MKIHPLRSLAHVRAFHVRLLSLSRAEAGTILPPSREMRAHRPAAVLPCGRCRKLISVPATSFSKVSLFAIHSAS